MKILSRAHWMDVFFGQRIGRPASQGSLPPKWIVATIAIWLLTGLPVHAQTYPSKPITFVVPFAAASATDLIARVLGQQLAGDLKGSVIVDNKPGAGGIMAAQAVANAAADGHTIFITTNTTHAANEHLFKRLPYDPVKDFTPVALLRKTYQVILVRPSLPVNKVIDLVELAKKQPGKLTFGSGSSSSRMAGELFKQLANVDILHVPYKSNPQVMTGVMANEVDFAILDTGTGMPLASSGKVRAIAVTSKERLARFPELPTIDGSGLKGYEMSSWTAVYLPRNAPKALVTRLNELFVKAMHSPAVTQLLDTSGTVLTTSTPEELAKFQAEETAKWGRIIRSAGIQPE
jgi:tripartite-type tricarboxylate transporter receptor subunit TctC